MRKYGVRTVATLATPSFPEGISTTLTIDNYSGYTFAFFIYTNAPIAKGFSLFDHLLF